ncbi:MAG: acylneuraminate cytidylyltransferase family protein [Butyrivibrio sp.]|nr:acylneuraminate cytidylyltransferase family protein [Butyrivibrio sp.]
MRHLAIIPARSGSKGIRDKNIRECVGKPLIAYSIEAAKESGIFDEIMVSTDSEHYAEVSRHYGAAVPFLRSAATSSDTASSWDAVREVLEGYAVRGQHFDTFCLLQPTSPLRTGQDIRDAYALHARKDALTVVSVCETDHSPLTCHPLPLDLALDEFLDPKYNTARRQDLETYYRFNGAIYISLVQPFLETGDVYRERCYAFIMDRMRSVDIDAEIDFAIVETILRVREQHG